MCAAQQKGLYLKANNFCCLVTSPNGIQWQVKCLFESRKQNHT